MTNPPAPVVILVEFDVLPHAVEAFVETLRIGAAQRSAFDGCLRVDAYRSAVDPTLFTLIEAYRSQADVDRYYGSALQRAWMDSLRPLIREMRTADQQPIYRFPPG